MNLYIRLVDGKPFEHPMLADNFFEVFPDVDPNNLPDWVAKFERVPYPNVGIYEVYEGVTYECIDGVFKDVHHIRPMTNSEKLSKQEEAKDNWLKNGGYKSWVFDEEFCEFNPPLPYPIGTNSIWNEDIKNWVESNSSE